MKNFRSIKKEEFKTNYNLLNTPFLGDDNKYYYLYKIEFPNGNYYLGKHKTVNLKDGYAGSGCLLPREYNRNNINETKKIIISFHENDKILNEEEEILIGDLYKSDEKCLNYMKGGNGGVSKQMIEESRKIRKGKKRSKESIEKQRSKCIGKKHSEETRQKMSNTRIKLLKLGKITCSGGSGVTMTNEIREKIRKARTGIKLSEETKQKLSKIKKEQWKIKGKKYISEDGLNKLKQIGKEKKLSEINKDKLKQGLKKYIEINGNPNSGKKRSEETKNKISKKLKGIIRTEETKNKISISKKGTKIDEKYNKIRSQKIKGRNNPNYKPNNIEMYDLNNNLIHTFDDCINAVEFVKNNINNKCRSSEIFVACKQNKIRYGHKWKML